MPRPAHQQPEGKRAPAPEDDLGVQDFLEGFALALTEGATEAIARLWDTPALVIADEYVHAVNDRDDVAMLFAGAREHYSTAGVCDTRPEIVRLDEITDRVVVVRVHWPWLDDEGNALGAECSTYTLRRDRAGDWRIRMAIMHGVEALN